MTPHLRMRHLTPQQRRVCRLLLRNVPPAGIGLELGIKLATVYDHMQHAYRTLGVQGLTDLLLRAHEHWQCCDLERFVWGSDPDGPGDLRGSP